jgi:hypothetical protein
LACEVTRRRGSGNEEYEEDWEYKEFGGRQWLGWADEGVFQAIEALIEALDLGFEATEGIHGNRGIRGPLGSRKPRLRRVHESVKL